MLNLLICFFWNTILLLICLPRYLYFKVSLCHGKAIDKLQLKVLLKVINKNKTSLFGRAHNFSSIKKVNDFRREVPISSYESYKEYIERIAKGEKNVLTTEDVLLLEPSSGSVSSTKYIPYTRSLKKEFLKAVKVWLFDVLIHHKRLLFGKTYWSITPSLKAPRNISSLLVVGFDSDTQYLGKGGKVIKRLLAVPEEVGKIGDLHTFKYITLLFLIREKNFRFISVWSPTFLILLLNHLKEWFPSLIDDIEKGTLSERKKLNPELRKVILKRLVPQRRRARELRKLLKENYSLSRETLYKKIWPNLMLVSCWADGPSESYAEELKRLLPGVPLQPKGLIATEGVVSFPLGKGKGGILAIDSHFFEFIELDSQNESKEDAPLPVVLAGEVRQGRRYSVVITTGGGLYRYKLQDIIEVVGFMGTIPIIKFISREAIVSDLFGEKINSYHIYNVLKQIFFKYALHPLFFMVAPEDDFQGNHFYTLFVSFPDLSERVISQCRELSKEVEKCLQDNYHYHYCRQLGQLLPLRVFLIENSQEICKVYTHTSQELGQRLGDIKPVVLHREIGWSKKFSGYFINI